FVKVIKDFEIFDMILCQFIIRHPLFIDPKVFHEAFGRFGIIPKIRVEGLLFFVLDFDAFGIYVKDTSLTRQGVQ
ncbi:MAG: hypothetical protein KJO00_01760, partial [Bacteroidia bacterium]|nr:hypothetical protein [Bacteroidia bacterium]